MKFKILIISSIFYLLSSVPAFAAELTIEQGKTFFKAGEQFTVDLVVAAQEKPINVVSIALSYNHDLLRIISVDKDRSALELWAAEPQYNNDTGVLEFAGGFLGDGFKGNHAQLLRVTFEAVRTGTTSIAYTDQSSVLLADGQGTPDTVAPGAQLIHIGQFGSTSSVSLLDMLAILIAVFILSIVHRLQMKENIRRSKLKYKIKI